MCGGSAGATSFLSNSTARVKTCVDALLGLVIQLFAVVDAAPQGPAADPLVQAARQRLVDRTQDARERFDRGVAVLIDALAERVHAAPEREDHAAELLTRLQSFVA